MLKQLPTIQNPNEAKRIFGMTNPDRFEPTSSNPIIFQQAWQHIDVEIARGAKPLDKSDDAKLGDVFSQTLEQVSLYNDPIIRYVFRDVYNILIVSNPGETTAIIKSEIYSPTNNSSKSINEKTNNNLYGFNVFARNLNHNEIYYKFYDAKDNPDKKIVYLYVNDLNRLPSLKNYADATDSKEYHPLFLDLKYSVHDYYLIRSIFNKFTLFLTKYISGFFGLLLLRSYGIDCSINILLYERPEIEISIPSGWKIASSRKTKSKLIKIYPLNKEDQNTIFNQTGKKYIRPQTTLIANSFLTGKLSHLVTLDDSIKLTGKFKCKFCLVPRKVLIFVESFSFFFNIFTGILLYLSLSPHIGGDMVIPLMACVIAAVNIEVWSYFTYKTMHSKGMQFFNTNLMYFWIGVGLILLILAFVILFIRFNLEFVSQVQQYVGLIIFG